MVQHHLITHILGSLGCWIIGGAWGWPGLDKLLRTCLRLPLFIKHGSKGGVERSCRCTCPGRMGKGRES